MCIQIVLVATRFKMYVKYILSKIHDFLRAQVRFSKMQIHQFYLFIFLHSYSGPKSSAQLTLFWMPIKKTEFINLKTEYDIAEAV